MHAGGVAGAGGLAEPVHGDVLQPVRQVPGHAAPCGGDGQTAVAGGDLVGELVGGLAAGGGVDPDAFAGVAGGEDVSGGLPVVVLALVDGALAVRRVFLRGVAIMGPPRSGGR